MSVCTPTFNRRPFIHNMFEMFNNQNYPKDNIEWIIVDDGTDKIDDLVQSSGIPQIKYFAFPQKLTLGKKRNFTHSKCKGDVIVYMDDDDYYPPTRISHAVETLMRNPHSLCCGSSEIYTYFNSTGRMFQFGPYGANHATAGTFAFRKELLNITQYNELETIGEERHFLKNYTIPFAQLNPVKTILVFSHSHNTFDKNKMLENVDRRFAKESENTVDDFIKLPKERKIKEFFLNKMDELLISYELGHPSNKPDVLEQIKVIEAERRRLNEQGQGQGIITMHKDGEEPVQLTAGQIVDIIQNQQREIERQNQVIRDLQEGKIIYLNEDGDTVSLTRAEILHKLQRYQRELMGKDGIIQNLQKQLLQSLQSLQSSKQMVSLPNYPNDSNDPNFTKSSLLCRLKSEPEVKVCILET